MGIVSGMGQMSEQGGDNMGLRDLFRPKWQHSNPKIRCEAIAELDNQALLAQIACIEDEALSVRKAALQRMTDQSLLGDIARGKTEPRFNHDLRKFAASKIKDKDILASVAMPDWRSWSAPVEDIHKAAVMKIKDQALLAKIAKKVPYDDRFQSGRFGVQVAAVKRIRDQSLLADIAANEAKLR